jgi:acetaldehyde dehydrogenase (acetylating)
VLGVPNDLESQSPMPDADLDRDLESIHEARVLARAARQAQQEIEQFDQEQVDAIVEAMAAAGLRESERLATMAREETGFGNIPDKILKNNFVLQDIVGAIRGMRTVGVLREDPQKGVLEIAEPVGVVAGIIPTTNPTSTAMFKCLIAVKARCGIVLSPHPAAKGCIQESARLMHDAAVQAGAPRGLIACMNVVSMEGTRELMNGRDTDLILATGGIGLVKAAYSAGKPAYGVGPGNVPAYIERSADVGKAVRDIIAGTTFDNGTLCSSEQAIVCDRAISTQVQDEVKANGGHFLSAEENERLAAVLITDDLMVSPRLVGHPAEAIAAAAGIIVPDGTRVLVCPLDGVGKEYPLSREKLSPVLAYYVVEDWHEGCERCMQLLSFGGLGHTLSIHSQDRDVILEFGLRKPAHRVLVNTVSALGAVGYTTSLFPSMTLGCGSWGNNITSDNIGPQHLLNIKRLAYETRPLSHPAPLSSRATEPAAAPVTPVTPAAPAALESRIAAFLSDRGVLSGSAAAPPSAGRNTVVSVKGSPPNPMSAFPRASSAPPSPAPRATSPAPSLTSPAPNCGCSTQGCGCSTTGAEKKTVSPPSPAPTVPEPPRGRSPIAPQPSSQPSSPPPAAAAQPPLSEAVEFVSETDVRDAMAKGEKICIGPATIITPLGRELGDQHGVFKRQ